MSINLGIRFIFFFFCFCSFQSFAQVKIDSSIQYPVKGFVRVGEKKIKISGFSYADSNNLILFIPGSNLVNGAYTYKGDARTMQKRNIPIQRLRLLKVKRQSFVKGAAIGGLAGLGAGYLVGMITYNNDFSIPADENDRYEANHRLLTSLAVGIPSALAGGLMGGIFIKKRFRINGDAHLLQKAIDRIYK